MAKSWQRCSGGEQVSVEKGKLRCLAPLALHGGPTRASIAEESSSDGIERRYENIPVNGPLFAPAERKTLALSQVSLSLSRLLMATAMIGGRYRRSSTTVHSTCEVPFSRLRPRRDFTVG